MADHKLFISWSKSQASIIAPLLRDFFEDVLGFDEIFLSQKIDSGRRWSDEIARALESCDAGLILVTAENLKAPWLNFEAGAISKKVEDSNVIPILWGVSVGDLSGSPLNQFQSKTLSKDGLWEIVQSLGQLWDISMESLERRFAMHWPALSRALADLPEANNEDATEIRIDDVFSMLQRLESQITGMDKSIETLSRAMAYVIQPRARSDSFSFNNLDSLTEAINGPGGGMGLFGATRQPSKSILDVMTENDRSAFDEALRRYMQARKESGDLPKRADDGTPAAKSDED